jgi:hypothetical protein
MHGPVRVSKRIGGSERNLVVGFSKSLDDRAALGSLSVRHQRRHQGLERTGGTSDNDEFLGHLVEC